MVTKSLPVIAVLSLMTSSVLTRADFTPKPNQKKLDHEINADFRGLPYQDKLEGKGSFVIKPIDKDAEIKNDWKKSQDGYSDEAAYKILIPPRESVVRYNYFLFSASGYNFLANRLKFSRRLLSMFLTSIRRPRATFTSFA